MDQQGDAQEDQNVEESTPEVEPYSDDSASDKDGDEDMAAEPEDDIDETVTPSPKKMQTRRNGRKVLKIPDTLICSDPEDEESRPWQRKRTHANATPIRAGGNSKKFCQNSANQFPSISSKQLAARKGRAGSRGPK